SLRLVCPAHYTEPAPLDSCMGGSVDRSWPLVGRVAELEQVSRLLRSRRGAAVLAGPAGVGTTRLATECLSIAAARGFVPLRVPAPQGAAGLPFGAYAALVPELEPGRDLLAVLRQIAQAVRRQGEGKQQGTPPGWRRPRGASRMAVPCCWPPRLPRLQASPGGSVANRAGQSGQSD